MPDVDWEDHGLTVAVILIIITKGKNGVPWRTNK